MLRLIDVTLFPISIPADEGTVTVGLSVLVEHFQS
jgi:hypothetical protein